MGEWDRHTFLNIGEGMRTQKIQEVLATIPQEQYKDAYTDTKGVEGFRNPVRDGVARGITEIVEKLGFKSGVELGTALGSSGLHMALGGMERLDTVEMDPEAAGIAQRNFKDAGVGFTVHCMDSGSFIEGWNQPIDFLFIDHAKSRTLEDLVALEPYLAPNALVLVDNSSNRGHQMQDAIAHLGGNYHASIYLEAPTGGETTGLLVASKSRATYETAMTALEDTR